jgi:hypothetical protein
MKLLPCDGSFFYHRNDIIILKLIIHLMRWNMKKIILWVVGIIVVLGVIGAFNSDKNPPASTQPQSNTKSEPKKEKPAANDPEITMAEFTQIKNGMTYDEVVKTIGGKGELQSTAGDGQYKMDIYSWKGNGFGANATISFQGGKVGGKGQLGLQ